MSDYAIITEGEWEGVSFRINSAEVIEEDGKPTIKFDFDVKGVGSEREVDFENYLGHVLSKALELEIENNC